MKLAIEVLEDPGHIDTGSGRVELRFYALSDQGRIEKEYVTGHFSTASPINQVFTPISDSRVFIDKEIIRSML